MKKLRSLYSHGGLLLTVFICALLWGSAFPCIKAVYRFWGEINYEPHLSSRWLLAGLRFLIAGGVLLLISGLRPALAQAQKVGLRPILAMSLGQTFFQYLLFYTGLAYASGSLSAVMANGGSFWWVILAPWYLKTPSPSPRQWAMLLIGFCGVVLAVSAPGSGGSHPILGSVLILLSNLGGTFGIMTFSKMQGEMSAKVATGWSLFIGGVLLCLVSYQAWDELPVLMGGRVVIGATLWLAFVSAAAFSLWNALSTQHSVNVLATYRFLIPIVGVVESLFWIPEETMGWGLMVGAILVIVAITGVKGTPVKAVR